MSLRDKVLSGGVYLMLRQGLGVLVSAVGVLLLTRAIGPGNYGLWAAALGIYYYLFNVSRLGIEVYLIRSEEEPRSQDYHQAFTLLLLLGLTGTGLGILALPLIERWVRLEGFSPVAMVLFVALPVSVLGLVPLVHLERALEYKRIALIELCGLTTTYAVALPLAYGGLGPWAPVSGWWAQQLLTLCLLYRRSTYRPRLHWEAARARAMLRYGLSYSASNWIWQLRDLVNPLLVGRYAGAEAVGYVALASRLVQQFSFDITGVVHRLSIAALARIQVERRRLTNAVAEGTNLQLMALGPLLVGAGLVAYYILPPLLGASWVPVLEIYPFIALHYLGYAMFSLSISALQVLRRNREVAAFHLLHIVVFAAAAALLVPRLGFIGYGWAEVVALPTFVLLQIWVRSRIGRVSYARAGVWFLGWSLPLFSPQLGPLAWVSLVAPLLWPAAREELLQAAKVMLWRARKS